MAEANTSDREIVLTRLLPAPRELVWKAYTDPKHVGHWWGPRGFTTTTHEMDVRPGGVWKYTMHGPDGTDYENKTTFLEAVRPERLVYDHGDFDRVWFHVTVTFADEAGRTRLVMRSLFDTVEEYQNTVKFGAVEGGRETLDRLTEYLGKMG
jgi:uncharacterized protein YndB with AHSA1/START domain